MKKIKDFYNLRDIEDYFNFFDLDYDQSLVNVKRFHILKEYGDLIKTGIENFKSDESRLLDFLKFSLIRVYGDYKSGHSPSAAEVFNIFSSNKLSGCSSCTPVVGDSCGC